MYRNSSNFIVLGPGRLNCQNKTQAHNNRHLLNTQGKPLHLANVNVRSVRNKTTDIVDYVITNDADICVVTEAWLKDRDSVSIVALSPPGYIFKNFLRQYKRKVGGTGKICTKSASKKQHSIETGLVRVQNDLLMPLDSGCSVILLMLDLSAAFDTIDHSIMLHRLSFTFYSC